jgi:hypothetical protein
MCCFSAPVDSVSRTNIFGRSLPDGRQTLVYQMTLSMKEDLAMILPLPVPAGTAEDAVRWIDLKAYPTYFEALDGGFPKPRALFAGAKGEAPVAAAPPLKVVDVGDFEASFVPTVKDFGRLDARFRLPDGTWDALPAVKGFGFAVFKLKKGSKTVHPMAFDFPRADGAKLFFPTIHIHDGKVHATADFDHALYAQGREGETHDFMSWQESHAPAGRFMDMRRAKEVVDPERHVHLKRLVGRRKNEDVLV